MLAWAIDLQQYAGTGNSVLSSCSVGLLHECNRQVSPQQVRPPPFPWHPLPPCTHLPWASAVRCQLPKVPAGCTSGSCCIFVLYSSTAGRGISAIYLSAFFGSCWTSLQIEARKCCLADPAIPAKSTAEYSRTRDRWPARLHERRERRWQCGGMEK